jgi:hypothetical protein
MWTVQLGRIVLQDLRLCCILLRMMGPECIALNETERMNRTSLMGLLSHLFGEFMLHVCTKFIMIAHTSVH